MHTILQIPEILLNIFCHLDDCDLAALARTCRTFKESALDILWSELDDLSPLSLCLPEISHSTDIRVDAWESTTFYRFSRPLEQADWDILCSYTRRVWCIQDLRYDPKLDWNFLTNRTPTADPLFPNLRSLLCTFTEKFIPFLCLPLPSLIQLDIRLFREPVDLSSMLQDSLRLLARTSPKIRSFRIADCTHTPGISKIVSDSICSWSNLHTIISPNVALNVDALMYLSHMPTLAQLTCRLSNTILHETVLSDSPSFSNWNRVELHVTSLAPVSGLLSRIRLPVLTTFTVVTESRPSKQELAFFMAGIQISGMGQTIQRFDLQQDYMPPDTLLPCPPREPDAPLLELNDLWSCIPFHNLHHINIDLNWNVHLSDDQLLMLGSAWPQLKELSINPYWGWNSRGGITPIGLAQFLDVCPFLMSIALVIDTHGFTRLPLGPLRKSVNFSSFEGPFSINVIDSVVREESMDTMAAFFCSIAPHFYFDLTSWDGWTLSGYPESEPDSDCHPHRLRWKSVYRQTNALIRKKWLNVVQQLIFQPRPRV